MNYLSFILLLWRQGLWNLFDIFGIEISKQPIPANPSVGEKWNADHLELIYRLHLSTENKQTNISIQNISLVLDTKIAIFELI